MTVTIYHNPNCSKSRQTLALIREYGIEPDIIEYLRHPPQPDELKRIIDLIGMTARELLRSGEKEFRELGLDSSGLTDQHLIHAMCEHPRLIQRPIVVANGRACIGRPPEAVTGILP